MRPKNEELLYFLLWTADTLLRPSWRHLEGDSFEAWAWRNGLGRRLAELARDQLIERHPDASLDRVVRLTEAGQQLALGGRNPARQWSRNWDGKWRLVLFDVPVGRDELRQQLLRVLRRRHFGCLQKSVWASPDPTSDVRAALGESRVQTDAFLVMEGHPAAGESDAEIVEGGWDFDLINKRYEHYLVFAAKPPPEGKRVIEWAQRENAVWKAALTLDPLLPARLLPPGYKGKEAFERRKELCAQLAGRSNAPVH
jgi:phenylacetic acid degradation operon negative regulatory protein